MAATATKSKADDKAAKAKEAKAKERDKAAKAKEKEQAAKAKEREKAAKAKEREKAAKAKEQAAKAKERDKAAKAKEKEKAAKAKAKEKEKAAKAKDKERAAKAKEREQAANAKEREQAAAKKRDTAKDDAATPKDEADAVPQPVEEVAVPERGETTEVPAEVREEAGEQGDGGALPALDVPDNDTTVHPKGYIAETLGREDAVDRSTQRATLAASYTTRDHDVIRAWAQSRGGRPADVEGTGNGARAGVLRIEFPDGPGDDSRLEDVDWSAFFATFDDSDVDFLYQERVRTGDVSRFHKFVRADS